MDHAKNVMTSLPKSWQKIEMTCSTLTDAEVVALLSEEDEEQKEYERLVDEYNQTLV